MDCIKGFHLIGGRLSDEFLMVLGDRQKELEYVVKLEKATADLRAQLAERDAQLAACKIAMSEAEVALQFYKSWCAHPVIRKGFNMISDEPIDAVKIAIKPLSSIIGLLSDMAARQPTQDKGE